MLDTAQKETKNKFRKFRPLFFVAALFLLQFVVFLLIKDRFLPEKIAFMSNREGNYELYVMNPDGSDLVNLTGNEAQDGMPSWSRKLRSIAFLSSRDTETLSLYRMDASGKKLIALAEDMPIIPVAPFWSPNGDWLAFDSGASGQSDIYLVEIRTGNVRNLTNDLSANRFSDWSPDSKFVLFTSTREDRPALYVTPVDGSQTTRLTDIEYSSALADWSPDGKKIAFTSEHDGNVDIYLMDTNGENVTRVTTSEGFDGFPVWSPDGKQIAFVSYRDENADVYVIDANGENEVNLTNHPAQDAPEGDFTWSPDGKSILFHSERDGNVDIFLINTDGSGLTNLTNDPAVDLGSVWIQ